MALAEGNGAGQGAEAVLVDTDVFSYLGLGGRPAEPWIPLVAERYVLVSFVTAGELKAGAEFKNWGHAKRADLDARLASSVIVPYDSALIDEYARVYAEARRQGHALAAKAQANDRWIAATARLLDVPLLTNNRAHFAGLPRLELPEPA
jgi:predicted nucleic acid-binding protein